MYENATYPANDTAPEFSFTWSYPYRPANASVLANLSTPAIHAFPQIRIADNSVLPITLENLGEVNLKFSWTMGVGKERAYATSKRKLGAHRVNSTVALDMYLDQDREIASNAAEAAFEVIVFLARFGEEGPVGPINSTVVQTASLQGIDFDLFVGRNTKGQNVFSWISSQPIYQFQGDITPLFDSILDLQRKKRPIGVDLPTFSEFLGYVGFGSQAFNADTNVTFYVPVLSIDVRAF